MMYVPLILLLISSSYAYSMNWTYKAIQGTYQLIAKTLAAPLTQFSVDDSESSQKPQSVIIMRSERRANKARQPQNIQQNEMPETTDYATALCVNPNNGDALAELKEGKNHLKKAPQENHDGIDKKDKMYRPQKWVFKECWDKVERKIESNQYSSLPPFLADLRFLRKEFGVNTGPLQKLYHSKK